MTKAEIAMIVHDRIGLSKKESGQLVDEVLECIKRTLAEGQNVKLSGFGNFVLRDKSTRKGRNPQTGEGMAISARRVVTFKASPVLKNGINKGSMS